MFKNCLSIYLSLQNVALASLVRIAYILCKQTSPSTLLSLQAPSTSMSLSALDSIRSIRTALSSPTGWLPFLQGVSQSHPKGQEDGGGSAQWSLGIDHVLRCSEYLENLFPRKMSSCRTESALFSRHFRLCHAGLFLTLTSLLSSGSPSALSTDAISPLSVVASALAAAKSMVRLTEDLLSGRLQSLLNRLLLSAIIRYSPSCPRMCFVLIYSHHLLYIRCPPVRKRAERTTLPALSCLLDC
jgi:hypothetical protein